jgi:PAS domain S-box-containing protein
MTDKNQHVINIALVGGRGICKEVLEKTSFNYMQEGVNAPILAVADPDPDTPGMVLARELGLLTFSDYYDLYDPRYSINLIIITTPNPEIFKDILRTRPTRIRIMSCRVFEIFWKMIGHEEHKLREQNKAMETILNGIQDFIMVIKPDMEVVDVNEAFLTKMGVSRQEVIGRKCKDAFRCLHHQSSTEELLCPLNEAIRNKGQCRQIRTRMGKNGEPRYFEVDIYPIWEKDGKKISKFIHISRDITKRKKEEKEITRRLEQMVEERTRQLKETHDKLLHQDKMASLGKLSASVVHEINNPIAGILNLIILIKRVMEEGTVGEKEIDQFRGYLDLMETETRRTSRIVSNLLAFSRQSKMELKRINLNRLIEQTLFLNSNLLKINGVKVEKQLDPNLPDLVGSEDQLQQALMNFVSNAAEAVEATGGGVLSIETCHILRNDQILVRFEDTGIGIPDENLSKLFEPFFTTKKKGKGVGLGLSVAYGIIQEHNGSISLQSEVGKGTILTVRLPLKQDAKPPVSEA